MTISAPRDLAAASTARPIASGNRSLRARIARRLMLLFCVIASARGSATDSLGVSVEKISCEAWWEVSVADGVGAIIGISYFSDTVVVALVAPESNGANRKLTPSCVIRRSADCTARGVLEA